MDTKIIIPIQWIDKKQRNYESPFCRAFSRIQNRYKFGASYDINPKEWFEVNVWDEKIAPQEESKITEMVLHRTMRFLKRQHAKGIISLTPSVSTAAPSTP